MNKIKGMEFVPEPEQYIKNVFGKHISIYQQPTSWDGFIAFNSLLLRHKEGSQVGKDELLDFGCNSPRSAIALLRSQGAIIKTIYTAEWINSYHFRCTTKYELLGLTT